MFKEARACLKKLEQIGGEGRNGRKIGLLTVSGPSFGV